MVKLKLESGIKVLSPDSKNPFRKLLEGWAEATTQYCETADGQDASYFNNERSNISLLAAGAWLKKGVALEEYQTVKSFRSPEDPDTPQERKGRCDLYVDIKGHQAEIEAKAFLYRGGKTEQQLSGQVKKQMERAVGDAKALNGYYPRAGCVFFLVRVHGTTDMADDELEKAIRVELDRYRDILAGCSDIYGWCFPECNRRLWLEDHGDFFPGVIAAFKLLDLA